MGHLRSRTAYADAAWDWEILDGCFGYSRTRPSDLDGIVERNGRFLVLEAKPAGKAISAGQMQLLRRLAALPEFTVILFWGDNGDPTRLRWMSPDYDEEVEGNLETLRRWVSHWWSAVNHPKGDDR